MKKFKVGIIGATGMVGQRFVLLTANHPWFELTALAVRTVRAKPTPRPSAASGTCPIRFPRTRRK